MLRQTFRALQSSRAFRTISFNRYTFMRRVYYPGILHRFHTSALRGLPPTCSSSMHTDSDEQHSDLFRYTGGRWLWDEEQQLLDHHVVFDVEELQRVAARSVEANACLDIKKCGEGGYNKVFRLTMDNGMVVIARIPKPNAGPAGYTTASEVATMDFARTVLQIPLPKVFAWDSRANNPVGSEYIIMEEAEGAGLDASWGEMELEQKATVVEDVVAIEKKLCSVSLSRYGNIYYASDSFEGCEKACVTSDVSEALRKDVEARFVIGPTTEREFWSKERQRMNIDRGPWKTSRDYVAAIVHREIAWIEEFADPKSPSDPFYTSQAQNSPEAHISLLQKLLKVTPFLIPQDADMTAPTLWHSDMHASNIFVSKGRITSLIDWQAAWTGPFFIQARPPKLLDHRGELLLKLPENFKELEVDEQNRLSEQVSTSILMHVYETHTATQNPLLSRLYRLQHGTTRTQPILFAGDTWQDDILPLRESLIRVERYWEELDVETPCPFHFTKEELQSHAKDGEGWNEAQDFWDSVAGLVDRDGWTAHSTYAEASKFFSEIRQIALGNMTGKERESFEVQTRWAEGPWYQTSV